MKRILFVCHGNICRSPMAEYIMKHLVAEAGQEDNWYIASAATSTEELGNPVYPPAARVLREKGYNAANWQSTAYAVTVTAPVSLRAVTMTSMTCS